MNSTNQLRESLNNCDSLMPKPLAGRPGHETGRELVSSNPLVSSQSEPLSVESPSSHTCSSPRAGGVPSVKGAGQPSHRHIHDTGDEPPSKRPKIDGIYMYRLHHISIALYPFIFVSSTQGMGTRLINTHVYM